MKNFGYILKNIRKNSKREFDQEMFKRDIYVYTQLNLHGIFAGFYDLNYLLLNKSKFIHNDGKEIKYKTIKRLGKVAKSKNKLLQLDSVFQEKDPRNWKFMDYDSCVINKNICII